MSHQEPRFVLYADASSRVVDNLAGEAGDSIALIEGNLGLQPSASLLDIYLFPSRRSMRSYLREHCPKQASMAAACFAAPGGFTVTLVEGGGREKALLYLRHEITHYVLASHYWDFPPWIDEGLARYFERKDPDAPLPASDLRVMRDAARRLEARELEILLSVPSGGELTRRQYRQATAAARYLMTDPDLGPGAVRCYLETVRSDGRPLEHFQTCFGASPGEFVEGLRRFYGP